MDQADGLNQIYQQDTFDGEAQELHTCVRSEDEQLEAQLDEKLEIVNCLLNHDLDVRHAKIDGEAVTDLVARASDPAWVAAVRAI